MTLTAHHKRTSSPVPIPVRAHVPPEDAAQYNQCQNAMATQCNTCHQRMPCCHPPGPHRFPPRLQHPRLPGSSPVSTHTVGQEAILRLFGRFAGFRLSISCRFPPILVSGRQSFFCPHSCLVKTFRFNGKFKAPHPTHKKNQPKNDAPSLPPEAPTTTTPRSGCCGAEIHCNPPHGASIGTARPASDLSDLKEVLPIMNIKLGEL